MRSAGRPLLCFSAAVLTLGLQTPSLAHNGHQAVAIAVTGITIDGDLSDWPDDMPRYPVTRTVMGEPPASTEDFRAWFRVGYSAQENALYVAVEVSDDVLVVDTGDPPDWNTEDYCSVYLDLGHGMLQYRSEISPGERNLTISPQRYPEPHEEAVVAAVHDSVRHIYESRTDVERISQGEVRLRPGMGLGFDVGITDLDEGSSFTWLSWGPQPLKFQHADNLGDLLLAGDRHELGTVYGQVTDARSGDPWPHVSVRAENLTRGIRIEVTTRDDGTYLMRLPPGSYGLTVPGAAESQDLRFSLGDGTRKARHFTVAMKGRHSPGDTTIPAVTTEGGTGPELSSVPRWPSVLLIGLLGLASVLCLAVLAWRRHSLGQLLVAPREAMQRVAEKPDWGVPALAVISGTLIVTIPIAAKLAVQFMGIGPGRMALLGGLIAMPAFTIVASLLFEMGSWVVRTGGLLVLARAFGGRVPFLTLLAVVGYALIPESLFSAILLAVNLHFGVLSASGMWAHGSANLAHLLPDLASSRASMGALLAEIDLFSIWSLILSVIGVQRLYRWPAEKAAVVVGIYWLLAAAAAVGVAAGMEALLELSANP